jgi:hypothetical protein
MSWTYSSSLATDRDRVRFLLQDTDTTRQLVQDEEITWVLTQEVNVYMAAAAIADSMAAKARGVSSKSVGDFSLSFTKEHWEGLAARLRRRGAGYQLPTVQGASISGKEALADDTDAVQPVFTRAMQENNGS